MGLYYFWLGVSEYAKCLLYFLWLSPEEKALSFITNEIKYKHFKRAILQRSLDSGEIIDSTWAIIPHFGVHSKLKECQERDFNWLWWWNQPMIFSVLFVHLNTHKIVCLHVNKLVIILNDFYHQRICFALLIWNLQILASLFNVSVCA